MPIPEVEFGEVLGLGARNAKMNEPLPRIILPVIHLKLVLVRDILFAKGHLR